MIDESTFDRALEAYSATEGPIGLEDIGTSDAYFDATEELASWFVSWFDANEAPENQSEEDAEAEQEAASTFAELWIAHLDEERDAQQTRRSLERASQFI